jgi:hypothetical protein
VAACVAGPACVACGSLHGVDTAFVACGFCRASSLQCAAQCSAVQCSAVQCSAVQCSAVQGSAGKCSAVQPAALAVGSRRTAGI